MTPRPTPATPFSRLAPWLGAACLALVATSASAQTLWVKGAPVGAAVDFVWNTRVVATAKANDEGVAIAPASTGLAADTPALVFMDTCGEARRRVVVVLSGAEAAPAEDGCVRVEVPGIYVVRPVSTLVVTVSGARPTMLLIQGKFNPDAANARQWGPSPTGLMLEGVGGYTSWGDAALIACGNVTDCKGGDSGFGFGGGAVFWLRPFLGVEGLFLVPGKMDVTGKDTGFNFNSSLEGQVLSIAGLVGIPAGPARIFGKGGATYHRATFSTTQTIDDTTITVDEIEQTIKGGTQTTELLTSGWGWLAGGGVEFWTSPRVAIYTEFTVLNVKGNDRNGGEGLMDDRIVTFFGGVRFRIGKK